MKIKLRLMANGVERTMIVNSNDAAHDVLDGFAFALKCGSHFASKVLDKQGWAQHTFTHISAGWHAEVIDG